MPAPRWMPTPTDSRCVATAAPSAVSPPAREIYHSNRCISAIIEESDISDDGQPLVRDDSFMMEQFRILREENRADISRMEKEAREERERLLLEHQREREFMNNTILAIQNSVTMMTKQQQNLQTSPPVTAAAHTSTSVCKPPEVPVAAPPITQPSVVTPAVTQPSVAQPPVATPTVTNPVPPHPIANERELTLQG